MHTIYIHFMFALMISTAVSVMLPMFHVLNLKQVLFLHLLPSHTLCLWLTMTKILSCSMTRFPVVLLYVDIDSWGCYRLFLTAMVPRSFGAKFLQPDPFLMPTSNADQRMSFWRFILSLSFMDFFFWSYKLLWRDGMTDRQLHSTMHNVGSCWRTQ